MKPFSSPIAFYHTKSRMRVVPPPQKKPISRNPRSARFCPASKPLPHKLLYYFPRSKSLCCLKVSSCKITWNWNISGHEWGGQKPRGPEGTESWKQIVSCTLRGPPNTEHIWQVLAGRAMGWREWCSHSAELKKIKCSGKCRNSSTSLTSHLPLLFWPSKCDKTQTLLKNSF